MAKEIEWTHHRDEIRKIQRGVRVMWFVNFLFLAAVYMAGLNVAFLAVNTNMAYLTTQLVIFGVIGLIASAITMWWAVRRSDKFIASSIGAEPQEINKGPVYDAVEEAVIAAGLPGVPRVYISNEQVMNAYALGDHHGNAYVVFTRPLVNALDRDELQAVAAHEVAHITAGDSPDMVKLIAMSSMVSLVAGIAGRFMFFGGNRNRSNDGKANILALVIVIISLIFLLLAPLMAKIGNSFMSRQRESRADALAVKFTNDPTALASALSKINGITYQAVKNDKEKKAAVKKFNNTAGALAFYVPGFLGKTFSTHPPFEERISDLRRLGAVTDEHGRRLD